MKVSQIKRLYREFGSRIALSAVCASRFRSTAPWKHRLILRYLKEKYSSLIVQYQNRDEPEHGANAEDSPAPIWTLWWQGKDHLPDVVKLCHASIRRYCGDHPFIVLTQENYQDYIKLPEYIMEKVRSDAMTITHLSDIIRFALLACHGGLWLDSTVFVADRIPDEVFTSEYYTVKRPHSPRNYHVALDRWTNFLQAGKKGNTLCCFVRDFFLEYWKDQKSLIDYFLIDYAIELAYEEVPQCRTLLASVPIVNDDLYLLEELMNSRWDPAVFESIRTAALFSKLSWRKGGKREKWGHETLYGHLLAEEGL